MIEKYSIRTDLALEQKERFESDNVEVQGVVLEEDYDEEREIKVTTVKIETENGAKTMGKPVGTYITMEAPNMAVPDEDYHQEISNELAKFLERFIKSDKEEYSVLVVGLGNRKVTPDALGPYVVDNLNITRHIICLLYTSPERLPEPSVMRSLKVLTEASGSRPVSYTHLWLRLLTTLLRSNQESCVRSTLTQAIR